MINSTMKRNLLAMPGIGMALLPKLACPACWPAYAGLLSTLGVGFLGSTKYLLPLTATFLFVAVGCLPLGQRGDAVSCLSLLDLPRRRSSCSANFP
jgi:hypothetical protein